MDALFTGHISRKLLTPMGKLLRFVASVLVFRFLFPRHWNGAMVQRNRRQCVPESGRIGLEWKTLAEQSRHHLQKIQPSPQKPPSSLFLLKQCKCLQTENINNMWYPDAQNALKLILNHEYKTQEKNGSGQHVILDMSSVQNFKFFDAISSHFRNAWRATVIPKGGGMK